jgi:thiosulfate dehydrogenase [quinone] large subunit
MKKQHVLLGGLRILMGWVFLWPFFDKLFGLGFATASEQAWIMGGSPTAGFLEHAAKGPFADIFHSLAGSFFVDWLFMAGLLLIGLALLLGIGVRIAAVSGALLLFLMWLAVLPPKNNPLIDEHIIYIAVLKVLLLFDAGVYLGFGRAWSKTAWVKKYPFLK